MVLLSVGKRVGSPGSSLILLRGRGGGGEEGRVEVAGSGPTLSGVESRVSRVISTPAGSGQWWWRREGRGGWEWPYYQWGRE